MSFAASVQQEDQRLAHFAGVQLSEPSQHITARTKDMVVISGMTWG